MSASTQIAVLLENDVLVSCDETDAITVEGSESHSVHRILSQPLLFLRTS